MSASGGVNLHFFIQPSYGAAPATGRFEPAMKGDAPRNRRTITGMRVVAPGAGLCVLLFAVEEKLLVDFRASQTNFVPTMAAEAQRSVLSAVFPHRLESEADCKADEPATEAALEAARKSGQIVPELMSQAAGSFTQSGARQMAYLIKVGECSARGRSYFGTYRLAIFQGGRLIAADQIPDGDSIAALADVDGDGIQEILTTGCDFRQMWWIALRDFCRSREARSGPHRISRRYMRTDARPGLRHQRQRYPLCSRPSGTIFQIRICGCLSEGRAKAGIWTCCRQVLAKLSPPQFRGRFDGLLHPSHPRALRPIGRLNSSV